MSHYVVLLVAPVIIGSVIAVMVLLISGLSERRERRHMTLREARRRDSLDHAMLSARSASDGKDRRIAS